MKILNLYCGIGGNRKLWTDVEVTAVEQDPAIAKIYQDFFPDDTVIVGDAHQYLLDHYSEFDFIWSSPPCPSHSKVRKITSGKNMENRKGYCKPIYPDMKLYEEILFLQGYFEGKWCVENVIGWYKPLIRPTETGNHYFWSNFFIPQLNTGNRDHYGTIESLGKRKGFDLSKYSGIDKRKTLRNCVEPEIGKHILDSSEDYKLI